MSTDREWEGGEPVLELGNIRLELGRAGPQTVVFSLPGLVVNGGERLALTGPSGCGKSTLLHLVSGLLRPDSGTIEVLGRDPRRLRQPDLDRFRGTHLGFVFQTFQLLGAFTALENVRIGLRFGRTVPRHFQRDRAVALLERVGLGRRMHLPPRRLSVGERQRVAIARAIANRPRLLLADEPTGALDPATGDGIFSLLEEVCEEDSCALLLVTHDESLAGRLPRRFDCRGLVTHETSKPADME